MDFNNFQRIGSTSNAEVGRDFEQIAERILAERGVEVSRNFPVPVGVGDLKKVHRFDLGSKSPPVIVECKSHRWTTGGNVPSAKVTVWNEVMYYFSAAPVDYRKILFVLRDLRPVSAESLATYYVRTYPHLIPSNVEIWEYDQMTAAAEVLQLAGQGEPDLPSTDAV